MTTKGYPFHFHNRIMTSKHKELLPLLAQDKGNAEIARVLGIHQNAVFSRIERMMSIVLCADRAELVAYAKEYMQREQT